jgi:AmmeMemoRadiSam system protein B
MSRERVKLEGFAAAAGGRGAIEMSPTRAPAVAGFFYPEDSAELESAVASYLAAVPAPPNNAPTPKALIVPHAGYVYSGPIAASGYARIGGQRSTIRRVVLLGPSHRIPLRGLAASSADAFDTPLGAVPIDRDAIDAVLDFQQVQIFDAAHRDEHSLEVQLPFLQCVLEDFSLVPLSVGDADPEEVAEVIERLWGGPETLIVVSSDLSHYYDYETARRLDAATTRAIEALDANALEPESACGRVPARGLLAAAKHHGLSVETVDLRSSGDTAGDKQRVVGYGSYVFA